MAKKKKKPSGNTIAQNKKAYFEYMIEEKFEAGLVLTGWEVKSIREGRVQITDSYVHLKNNEAWLFNTIISPLLTASSHVVADPTGNRKLLLHRREIDKLLGKIEQKGYTVVPLAMYWKGHIVKLEIGLAKGKKLHDKRHSLKEKDWKRDKERLQKVR